MLTKEDEQRLEEIERLNLEMFNEFKNSKPSEQLMLEAPPDFDNIKSAGTDVKTLASEDVLTERVSLVFEDRKKQVIESDKLGQTLYSRERKDIPISTTTKSPTPSYAQPTTTTKPGSVSSIIKEATTPKTTWSTSTSTYNSNTIDGRVDKFMGVVTKSAATIAANDRGIGLNQRRHRRKSSKPSLMAKFAPKGSKRHLGLMIGAVVAIEMCIMTLQYTKEVAKDALKEQYKEMMNS